MAAGLTKTALVRLLAEKLEMSNKAAGLFLTTSKDGLKWTELKAPNGKSFLEPQVGGKLMRDPSLQRGPDGVFHLVWTTSWGRPPVFGNASSTD